MFNWSVQILTFYGYPQESLRIVHRNFVSTDDLPNIRLTEYIIRYEVDHSYPFIRSKSSLRSTDWAVQIRQEEQRMRAN